MRPHQAADTVLVQRIDGECARQGIECLRVLSDRGGRVRDVDEQIAERRPEFLTRPDGPVLEPVLRQQIARIRGDRGAKVRQLTAGPAQCRQPFERPYVDLDEPVREQYDEVITQLQQSVARLVTRKHPPRDVQGLVEIVDRRRRRPVRPQHLEQHVAMQPLITRQREQLDQRPRLPQPPHQRTNGSPPTINPKTTQQPNPHLTLPALIVGPPSGKDEQMIVVPNNEQLARAVRTFRNTDSDPAYLESPGTLIFVAVAGDEIVGWCWGYRLIRPDSSSMLYLHQLEVIESHRGQGIGRELVTTFMTTGKATGATKMFLTTGADNGPARNLYEALGGGLATQSPTANYWFLL